MTEEKLAPSKISLDWRPAVIVLVAIAFRTIYYVTFKPWWCADSEHYSQPVVLWLHGFFTDGSRTPVYPLFLGLAQWIARVPAAIELSTSAAEVVRDIQSALGLLATYLFYSALRTFRVRKTVAFVAGLFFATISLICNVEMAIVTPSLSLFLLVLGIWLYARMMARIGRGESATFLAIILGVTVAIATLLRPDNLIFFTVILLSTAAFAVRSLSIPSRTASATETLIKPNLSFRAERNCPVSGQFCAVEEPASPFPELNQNFPRRLLVACFLVTISAAPFILAWMTCNYVGTGRFRITNMMGVQMTQSVYNMFGQVDPEDQVLGSIMTKYYLATNRSGINREYVWPAMGELTARASQIPFLDPAESRRSPLGAWFYNLASRSSRRLPDQYSVAFADYLQRVCWKLIRKNPLGYLHNAADSFVRDGFDFTSSHSLSSPEETADPRAVEGGSVVKSRTGWEIVRWLGVVQAPFLTAFYVVTLAYVFFCPLILLNRSNNITTDDVAVTALALGMVATMVAFCLLESYHNQYGIPYLAVPLICTTYALNNFARIRNAMKGSPEEAQEAAQP
jgi:hypothetical protein